VEDQTHRAGGSLTIYRLPLIFTTTYRDEVDCCLPVGTIGCRMSSVNLVKDSDTSIGSFWLKFGCNPLRKLGLHVMISFCLDRKEI
jgi:hypothetical protein